MCLCSFVCLVCMSAKANSERCIKSTKSYYIYTLLKLSRFLCCADDGVSFNQH